MKSKNDIRDIQGIELVRTQVTLSNGDENLFITVDRMDGKARRYRIHQDDVAMIHDVLVHLIFEQGRDG